MVNPDRNLYEPPYDDALLYDSDLEPERPRSRPLVVLLGIVVLAAFAGVVWVAYNQGVKQGQRGTPLLTADAGPTRIIPDQSTTTSTINPAPDKSYERLWGETQEREGQENVLPQPEQPRTVPAPQDLASAPQAKPEGSSGGPFEAKASDVPPPAEDPQMDSTVGSISSLTEPGSQRPVTATRPAPSGGTPAVFGPRPQEDITSALPSVTPPVTVPRSVMPIPTPSAKTTAPKPVTLTQTPPAVAASKPASIASTSVSEKNASAGPKVLTAEPPAAPAAPKSSEKQIAALSPPAESAAVPTPAPAATGGSVMIQLGSFPNDALAASAWSRIKSTNQELLGSYSPSIKPAEIPGKGTWYRLRVGGFSDKASAKGVCEQLAAAGQACIVASK